MIQKLKLTLHVEKLKTSYDFLDDLKIVLEETKDISGHLMKYVDCRWQFYCTHLMNHSSSNWKHEVTHYKELKMMQNDKQWQMKIDVWFPCNKAMKMIMTKLWIET